MMIIVTIMMASTVMYLLELFDLLTLYTPTPQNGQTHSKNSSAVFDHFMGLTLKGLNSFTGVFVIW